MSGRVRLGSFDGIFFLRVNEERIEVEASVVRGGQWGFIYKSFENERWSG